MRWWFASLLVLSLIIGTGRAADIPRPDIWLGPLGGDLQDLFTDDAPWPNAVKKINVLALGHVWIRHTPKAQLVQIFDYAKRHGLKIDLSTEAVAKFKTDNCGVGEGYTYPGEIAASVQILASLGVQLDWVDIDEALWFGSYSTEAGKCRLSIPDLITRTALIMKDVLAVYPNVRIMEIEPIPGINRTPTWREDLTAFHTGLSQQLGRTIHLVQVDILWTDPAWKQALVDMRDYVAKQNMGLGIIYDGLGASSSDANWINSAINNIETIEGGLHIVPVQVTFTSWNPYPTHNLPEDSPTTMTWLINRYVRERSVLNAQFVGLGAHGKLTTSSGKPIPNATVNGYKPGVDFTKPLPVTTVSGVVPATAATVILGVRVNTECDGCNGLNDLLIGKMHYQETQGGSVQQDFSIPNTPAIVKGAIFGGEIVGGTSVTRIIAAPGQSLVMNSNVFPVTAGAQYQFTIPAATVGGLGWFGNVIIIWRDAQGNGTRLTTIPPSGKVLMSTAVTAADGSFALSKLPRNVDSPFPVTVEFDGAGGAFRSTIWTPLR